MYWISTFCYLVKFVKLLNTFCNKVLLPKCRRHITRRLTSTCCATPPAAGTPISGWRIPQSSPPGEGWMGYPSLGDRRWGTAVYPMWTDKQTCTKLLPYLILHTPVVYAREMTLRMQGWWSICQKNDSEPWGGGGGWQSVCQRNDSEPPQGGGVGNQSAK